MRSNSIRFTGMASGMDTDSIIRDMLRPQQYRIDNQKKAQALVRLKQDAWKDMNKKLFDFHTKYTHKMSLENTFNKNNTTSSNPGAMDIDTKGTVPKGTHKFDIENLAESVNVAGQGGIEKGSLSEATKVGDLLKDVTGEVTLGVKVNGQTVTFKVHANDSLEKVAEKMTEAFEKNTELKAAGITAEFNAKDGSFSVSSTTEPAAELKIDFALNDYFGNPIGGGKSAEFFEKLGFIKEEGGSTFNGKAVGKGTEDKKIPLSGRTKVADLLTGVTGGMTEEVTLGVTVNGKPITFKVDSNDSLGQVASKMNDALEGTGFTAQFDQANGSFFVSSTATGEEQKIDFAPTDKSGNPIGDANSAEFFEKLGFTNEEGESTFNGKDASYKYNGATFSSATNEIEINGIKATLKASTTETVTIASTPDTEATYAWIKEFVTEYNNLIDEIHTKMDTKPGKGIEPLTAEEREGMSESEIKLWEDKLNSSLFYRDDQLADFVDSARGILGQVFGGDGHTTLADLGIVTGGWKEKGKLHIMGDEDDELYANQPNKLKAALEKDPDAVGDFFLKVGTALYEDHNTKLRASNDLKSAMNFYNDKVISKKVETFDKEIGTLEDRMYKMEKLYVARFAAMEKMLSSLNNQSSWLSQQFGG